MPDIPGEAAAWFAVFIVVVNVIFYWANVRAVRVPRRSTGQRAMMLLAIALAIVALFSHPGVIGGVAAAAAIIPAAAFIIMTMTSRMPDKTPAVTVGQPAIDFTARDSHDREFTLSSLRGRPVLLKFFRGHW